MTYILVICYINDEIQIKIGNENEILAYVNDLLFESDFPSLVAVKDYCDNGFESSYATELDPDLLRENVRFAIFDFSERQFLEF